MSFADSLERIRAGSVYRFSIYSKPYHVYFTVIERRRYDDSIITIRNGGEWVIDRFQFKQNVRDSLFVLVIPGTHPV